MSGDLPLCIGHMKQLFVDDWIVESSQELKRTFHKAKRYGGNPVLTGVMPWERWTVEADGRTVVYDEEIAAFKMYYVAPLRDPGAPTGILYQTCYAVAQDGLHWDRPSLRQVERAGSWDNNILGAGRTWMRRANVYIDRADPDRARRFKMTFVDVIDGRTAIVNACSRDGISWQTCGDPWFRRAHSSCFLGWDPRIEAYVLYPRMPGRPNTIGRSISKDFLGWSEPELVLAPEPCEGSVDFKGLATFCYAGIYVGFLWVFRDTVSDVELAVSRDGVDWRRPFPGGYFLPRGEPGSWDSEMILAVAPIIHQDRIWIYYTGQNVPYTGEAYERVQEGWVEDNVRMQRAIGLAYLRLDGFVSLDAWGEPGSLTTRLFEIPGGNLVLNAAVSGGLKVEILDCGGRALPGFSADDCHVVDSDSVGHVMRWRGGDNLDILKGMPTRLRFWVLDGSLYAFWFRKV